MGHLSQVLLYFAVVEGAGGYKVHWRSWKTIGRMIGNVYKENNKGKSLICWAVI